MIPYFQLTHFDLGPVTIQVWGLCVAIGIVAAVLFLFRFARRQSLSVEVATDMAFWALLAAFIGARLVHVFVYDWSFYSYNIAEVLKVWHGGLSSVGGFLGAVVGVSVYAAVRRLRCAELLRYLDIAALALWLGWGIGRIGCFLIHDHPGTLSHFFLAVQYPSFIPCALPGGDTCFMPRHDLGLYESLLGFALFIVFSILFSRLTRIRSGLVAAYSFLGYAVVRFFLDFLRATDLSQSDIRYSMLTPAQWGMIVLILGLTFSLVYGKIWRPRKT